MIIIKSVDFVFITDGEKNALPVIKARGIEIVLIFIQNGIHLVGIVIEHLLLFTFHPPLTTISIPYKNKINIDIAGCAL